MAQELKLLVHTLFFPKKAVTQLRTALKKSKIFFTEKQKGGGISFIVFETDYRVAKKLIPILKF